MMNVSSLVANTILAYLLAGDEPAQRRQPAEQTRLCNGCSCSGIISMNKDGSPVVDFKLSNWRIAVCLRQRRPPRRAERTPARWFSCTRMQAFDWIDTMHLIASIPWYRSDRNHGIDRIDTMQFSSRTSSGASNPAKRPDGSFLAVSRRAVLAILRCSDCIF